MSALSDENIDHTGQPYGANDRREAALRDFEKKGRSEKEHEGVISNVLSHHHPILMCAD